MRQIGFVILDLLLFGEFFCRAIALVAVSVVPKNRNSLKTKKEFQLYKID
jgi:hypothetical protein